MTVAELKALFLQETHPIRPNDWELEEALEQVSQLPGPGQRELMQYVQVVWPISHSLCFAFLEHGTEYIRRFGSAELAEWVRRLLGCYEKDGLRGARAFMAESVLHPAGLLADAEAVKLEEVRGKLLPFLRGVSGMSLELAAASYAWTDTATIYLPDEVRIFPNRPDNERFYFFLACCQWGHIVLGTFRDVLVRDEEGQPELTEQAGTSAGLEARFHDYPDPELARALYHFLEFSRVIALLTEELPGLMRTLRPLIASLLDGNRAPETREEPADCFRPLLQGLVVERQAGGATDRESTGPSRAAETFRRLNGLYGRFAAGEAADWQRWEMLTGRLDFGAVSERLALRRQEDRLAMIKQLAAVIENTAAKRTVQEPAGGGATQEEGGSRMVVALSSSDRKGLDREVRINNQSVELPPELAELLNRIECDLGHVPEGYVQAAVGLAGRGRLAAGEGDDNGDDGAGRGVDGLFYDEWDYRRRGYRKNWCVLLEKELQPVRSQFIESTMLRYRGLMVRLRRQFEALRTQHRFVRRRRYGDEIDFDALVEAVSDRMAGIAPSERLFVRLLRDTRDIAVVFLVDMSNSTEGWVGKAIKESLVLLADVLEVVGDRYGIYGFSGMRRTRCELFRVKAVDEPFSDTVQQRICAINPREYTRMAPAVRHLTGLLTKVDSKIRLLIAISDGKPEDYDDYKGRYAIEDTRQALIEARGKGVIPFCITVDREPHAYLPHMFGKQNYIFVDSVEKLPLRLPEIYRLLTS